MNFRKFANARKAISLTLLIAFVSLNAAPFRVQTNLPEISDGFKADSATRAARRKSNTLWQVSVNNETERAAAGKLGAIVHDYGSFVVVAAKNSLLDNNLEKVRLETEISLPGTKFEPLDGDTKRGVNLSGGNGEAADYFIVQFAAPATDEWLDNLRNTGAEVVQYVPHQAFIVYTEIDAMTRISEHSRVRWVGRLLPEDKISPILRAQLAQARSGAKLNDDFSPLEKTVEGFGVFDVAVFSRADFDRVQAEISNVGGRIVRASKLSHNYFNSVRVEIAPEQVEELARLRDVVRIDAFIQPQAEDERAAQVLAGNYTSTTTIAPPGYNPLTQFGVNGSNVTVAVVDDGVGIPGDDGFYVTAANAVNAPLRGAAAGADGHGHLQASIIAGTAPFSVLDPTGYNYGLGIAPAAHIVNIPFLRTGYTGTAADFANDTVTTAGPNGVRGSLSNNSYGSGTNGNVYDSLAAQHDGFARRFDRRGD